MKATTPVQAKRILDTHKGEVLKLDIGCGKNKPPELGWIGMDIEQSKDVDIIHDVQVTPWPFKDETFTLLSAAGLIDKLNPLDNGLIRFMDEAWRVLKYDGQFRISCTFAGSLGFWSDPKNINGVTPRTFMYFDPLHPANLYSNYEPKPWCVQQCYWSPEGNLEILLSKRRDDASYHKK
jgi:hypothetical protein